MSFGITPVSGFPPPEAQEFPNYIQFRSEGVDLGGPDADVVNFVGAGVTATRGEGENANVVTVEIDASASPDTGGGSSIVVDETPTLVLSLSGNDSGPFDNSDFSNWAGEELKASDEAHWDSDVGAISFDAIGFYRVSVNGRIDSDSGSWPTDTTSTTVYGSVLQDSVAITRSVHSRYANGDHFDNSPGFVRFTDEYIIEITEVGQTDVPKLYADRYSDESSSASFEALVTVKRIP